MHEHHDTSQQCAEVGHQALSTIVWYCPHRQSFEARWTLHDDTGAVEAEEVLAFGPFDSWLDVERWLTTSIAARLHGLTAIRS